MKYYIGVDVGATKIAAGIMVDHRVPKMVTVATPTTNRAAVISAIAKIIEVFNSRHIAGIGVGMAGAVDAGLGLVYASPNLPADFRHVPLARLLKKSIRRPVAVENDAKCFTLAEATVGVGQKMRTVVGLTLGSGVGGGVVMAGKIVRGRNGLNAELGHTTVVEHGLRCSCGRTGHLESYACGGGMIRYYRQLTGNTVDMFELERRAQHHEKAAARTFTDCSEILALGLANVIATFNPDIVVLGGGMTRVPKFWRPAVRAVKQFVPYPEQLANTPIVKTKLGDRAGIIGAALVASHG